MESLCIHWYAVLGEIPACSFFGTPFLGARQYCSSITIMCCSISNAWLRSPAQVLQYIQRLATVPCPRWWDNLQSSPKQSGQCHGYSGMVRGHRRYFTDYGGMHAHTAGTSTALNSLHCTLPAAGGSSTALS